MDALLAHHLNDGSITQIARQADGRSCLLDRCTCHRIKEWLHPCLIAVAWRCTTHVLHWDDSAWIECIDDLCCFSAVIDLGATPYADDQDVGTSK